MSLGLTFAVDVALVPGRGIPAEILTWNRQISATWIDGFVFDADHVPHLTLLQAYVPERSLAEFHQEVKELVGRFDLSDLRQLSTTGMTEIPFREGLSVFGLSIQKTEVLQGLHDGLIEVGRRYHDIKGSGAGFFRSTANPESHAWVLKYPQVKGGAHFHPHITLGFGETLRVRSLSKAWVPPPQIFFDELVSAQLGDCCTVSSNVFLRMPL